MGTAKIKKKERPSDICVARIAEAGAPFGITKRHARRIAEALGRDADSLVIGNLYYFVFFGVPFRDVQDRVAISRFDRVRLEALVYSAMLSIENSGSTRTTIENLIKKCHSIEGNPPHTPPLFLGVIIQEKCRIDGEYVYRKHMYFHENRIAKNLKRTARLSGISVPETLIGKIETSLGIEYDETQKAAFSLLNRGVGILTGGPGTGKTTVLKGMLAAWQIRAGSEIVCCAPTGKAAERMRAATGLDAQTIHRTLGLRPYDGGYDVEDALPPDSLVVVDEVSMIDTELMDALTSAVVSSGCRLLLVGDEDQLQSVGPGAVLRDVIASGRFPVARLETIHRNGGAIVANSVKIRKGERGFFHGDDFSEERIFDDDELIERLLALHSEYYSAADPLACRIYTPVKNPEDGEAVRKSSTYYINSRLHDKYHSDDPFFQIGQQKFSVGDPVVITRNDYVLDVLNGDEGIVEEISAAGLAVRIGNERRMISGEALQFVDLAYAVTVHKAQGSSCETALVLVPDRPRCLLTRRLLYVAVTRAEKRCVLLHQAKAVEEAIDNEYEFVRETGLLDRLGGVKSVRKTA